MSKMKYYNALEIAQELKMSKSSAYRLIRQLNDELKQKGYITLHGKIPENYMFSRLFPMGGNNNANKKDEKQ